MGNKIKRFACVNKKEIAVFSVLFVITILLVIPATLHYAVKVFGWAVWFYLFAAYFLEALHCTKKNINLTTKESAFLILSIFFALATLHVAFIDREGTHSITKYIVHSYEDGTVGGAVLGIVTSPITVLFTYVWAIVFFLLLTGVFFYLFFRPFIFEGTPDPISREKKKKQTDTKIERHEILLDDSPFLHPVRSQRREPVTFMTTEEKALRSEKNARDMLFGSDKEEKVVPVNTEKTLKSTEISQNSNIDSLLANKETDLYDVRRYDLTKQRTDNSVKRASQILFGKESEEPIPAKQDIFPDEEEETLLFDDEKDNSIPDLLSSGSNPFLQALRQQANEKFAPSPINYSSLENEHSVAETDVTPETEETVEAEEFAENNVEEQAFRPVVSPSATAHEEKSSPLPRNDSVEVSSDYVYVNGLLVPVLKNANIPISPSVVKSVPAAPAQPVSDNVGFSTPNNVEESLQPQQPFRKIVQLVERPNLPYNKPPISLLQTHVNPNYSPNVENWDELKNIFENRLANFNIKAELVDAIKGPTVTLCALKLGENCSINKLYSVQVDLQRWLKSSRPIAIINQIPNTDYCGVQIPNEEKALVGFKEIVSSKEYREKQGDIVVALGKTAEGEIYVADLAEMPHALVAGETGSGKSVCLNSILLSVLFRYSPDEVKFVLIDLKQVEMEPYNGLPHMLLKKPLNSIPEIVNVLKWIKDEVVGRFSLFKTMHMRNLTEYNKIEGVEKLSRIIIVIDEASELMSDAGARKTLESTLNSLARIARAAGVHLIFATQNPVKTVITSEIQNNLPTKIALAVSDYVHSMVIFKSKGAECLLGHGDMYIKRGQEMVRVQGAFISTEELESVVNYIKNNNEYSFNDAEIEKILNGNAGAGEENKTVSSGGNGKSSSPCKNESLQPSSSQPVAAEENENEPDTNLLALKYCIDSNYVSCSYLQRKLKKGYNTVANILEELAAEGYISQVPQGSKEKREILISKEDFYKMWEEKYGTDDEHEMEQAGNSLDE